MNSIRLGAFSAGKGAAVNGCYSRCLFIPPRLADSEFLPRIKRQEIAANRASV